MKQATFPEFAVSSNNAFMFHKTDAGGAIVKYDIFHTKLTHVASVKFYPDADDVVCELVDVNGKFLAYLNGISRNDECVLLYIWKFGFNDVADSVRKKLKLKIL